MITKLTNIQDFSLLPREQQKYLANFGMEDNWAWVRIDLGSAHAPARLHGTERAPIMLFTLSDAVSKFPADEVIPE